jgi:hypothetical protein
MKITLTILSTCLIIGQAIGQNLIPNPGFEDTLECPSYLGHIQACSNWTYATQFSANYLNRCSNNSYNWVPTTSNQETLEGDGMIGLRGFSGPDDTLNYRAYVQVPLETPLVVGETYHISMHVMLHMLSNHAMKEIGAYFSTNPVWVNTSLLLPLTPFFEHNSNWLSNKTYWTQVTGSFIADSAYTNMVIGNFNTSENTSSNYLGNWGDNGSFYYIDEVCLSSLSTECVSLVASINNLDEDDKKLLQIVVLYEC